MKYFLDTEFDGFGGDLISLALVCEDGQMVRGGNAEHAVGVAVYGDHHDKPWFKTRPE